MHLTGLSAIVFAQPLFDRLQRNSGYLTQEGLGATELYLVAAVLLFGIPLVLLAIEALARLLGDGVRRWVHHCFIAGLLLLLATALLTEPLGNLRRKGIPAGWLTVGIAVAIAWWLTRVYRRVGWTSTLFTYASAGVVIFPVMFFASPRISAICFPPPPPSDQAHAEHPVSIVMVVFDGLSGMALLNEQHEIDSVRYPNFARLSQFSTYYRNASTVHYRTDNAVPAILSGRIPPGDLPPVRSEYPINLFTLLQETDQYDLTVFEPYTRLCPASLRYLPVERSQQERVGMAVYTLATVYRETSIPHDLPIPASDIPREWFRMPETEQSGSAPKTGLMIYSWDTDRTAQFEHFLGCLQPSERPALRFLHLVLPHYPWIYLPSGNRYVHESSSLEFPIGAHGIVGEQWGPDELGTRNAWRRYLLQVGFADRVLGQILDRLTDQGLFDSALLIVTADHGVAFTAGKSRRDPEPETLPAIVPVPLFIKLPGQTTGERTDRNVESIDILPTIAEVIGMEVPVRSGVIPIDGASLLNPRESPRPRKTLVLPSGQIAIDPDFPDKYKYVEEMTRIFGSGGAGDQLTQSDVHPEWVGRGSDQFRQGSASDIRLGIVWGGDTVLSDRPDVIPCLFKGVVENIDARTAPVTLAVEVNGQIAGVTRSLDDPESPEAWSALVGEQLFHLGKNEVAFYEVVEQGTVVELRRCHYEYVSE